MGEVLYSLAAPDDEKEICSLLAQCQIDRENVPKSIRATTEFQILCPETSICMMLSLVVAGSK